MVDETQKVVVVVAAHRVSGENYLEFPILIERLTVGYGPSMYGSGR